MTQVADDKEFQSRMGQLNDLLEKIQTIPDPDGRAITAQIIQSLMDFHGAALKQILEHITDTGALGQSIITDFAQDDLVSSMLLLYGLHPLDLDSRTRLALEKVRPALASHGGNVKLLNISEDGVVELEMLGNCHGCGSSLLTLKHTIEQALYDKAPDITAIHVAGLPDTESAQPAGFVSVDQLVATIGKHSLRGTNHAAP